MCRAALSAASPIVPTGTVNNRLPLPPPHPRQQNTRPAAVSSPARSRETDPRIKNGHRKAILFATAQWRSEAFLLQRASVALEKIADGISNVRGSRLP